MSSCSCPGAASARTVRITPPWLRAKRRADTTERAGDVPEVRQRALGPRRWVVQPPEVFRPRQHLGGLHLVEVEEFGHPSFCQIAPAAQEPRHAKPLRHVLSGVPGVEFGLPLRRDVMPNGNERPRPRDLSSSSPRLSGGSRQRHSHLTRARATRPPRGSDGQADASRGRRAQASALRRHASPHAGNPRLPDESPSAPA